MSVTSGLSELLRRIEGGMLPKTPKEFRSRAFLEQVLHVPALVRQRQVTLTLHGGDDETTNTRH